MFHCAGLTAIGQAKRMDPQTQAQLIKLAPIFDALGERPVDLTVLGSGAQASVWRIRTDRADYALRVITPGTSGLSLDVDARLRSALCNLGAAVVRPIMTSIDVDTPEVAAQWSLDEFVDGRPNGERLSRSQAMELGRTLAHLHQLDPSIWPEVPVQHPEALSLLARPYGSAGSRAIVAGHQQLVKNTLGQSGRALVVCHSDLHKNQVMRQSRSGIVLLDFGQARRCDARWDLGAALYAFGAENFANITDGYAMPLAAFDVVRPFAQTLAIADMQRGRAKGSAQARRFLNQNPV